VTTAGPSAVPKGTAGPDSLASHQRHFLPQDLAGALKRLDDVEIDALLAALITEAERRGWRPPSPAKEQPVADVKPQRRRETADDGAGSLTTGKLNAVRAAFQSDVRKASVTIAVGRYAPVISRACRMIGGSDLGRVNWTSTPHTAARHPVDRSNRTKRAKPDPSIRAHLGIPAVPAGENSVRAKHLFIAAMNRNFPWRAAGHTNVYDDDLEFDEADHARLRQLEQQMQALGFVRHP
jgi:hypothetical protein